MGQMIMKKPRWIGILAFAALAASAWAAAAAPATPVLIAEVEAALDKGDAPQAASLADAGLKEAGISAAERGRLLLYRGLARELLGAHDAAVGDLTQAIASGALSPQERAEALLQRGFLRDGQGRLDQATADYTAVIAVKDHGLATAFNNRANIYRRQNRLMEAQRDYLAALSAGSGKPQYSYYGLGQIAEAQHDTLMARNCYAKALAADADYSLAAERLAALGGPPEGTIADSDRVTLRPPAPVPASSVLSGGFQVATEGSRNTDDRIVLRPPARRGGADHVAPRQKPRAPMAGTATRVSTSSSSDTEHGPVLRPALYQTDIAPVKSAGAAGEVQLGAWRSQAEAEAGWDKARGAAPGPLGGLHPHIVMADLPGRGRYYRLRVATAPGQSRAGLCDSLVAQGVACLPARD